MVPQDGGQVCIEFSGPGECRGSSFGFVVSGGDDPQIGVVNADQRLFLAAAASLEGAGPLGEFLHGESPPGLLPVTRCWVGRPEARARNVQDILRRVTTAAPSISQRVHSLNRPNMVSVGTIVWLASELMFFAGLFAMFFTVKAQNEGEWPPPPAHLNPPYALPFTIILVASSFTCQWG